MRLRAGIIVALGCLAAVPAVPAVPAASAARARPRARRAPSTAATAMSLSRRPLPGDERWRAYDEAPADVLARPVRVIQVSGDVTNPDALANPGAGGTTTLTYTPGGMPPSLILDYGTDVGGTATFDVTASSGTTIQATYSETLVNLGNDFGGTQLLFISGTPVRTDSFPVASAGAVTAPDVQGAERYEQVTLATPGAVTLRGAGIDFTGLRETPGVLRGHFLSSDDLLNRVWYAGVYTLNLNQLPPGTMVEPGGVNQLHLLLDGAKRDRAVWSGDHAIADLTDYYSSDPAYVRDSNALFLEHPASNAGELQPASGDISQPGPLPGACSPDPQTNNECDTWSATYSMIVMVSLYHYYLYTGDLEFARQHWQAVLRQMAWDAQQVDSGGLFAVDSSDDADWNIDSIPGELTYVNAVYCEALQSAAALATALGQPAQSRTWSAQAAAIKAAVNKKLWDARTGVYDGSTSSRGAVVQDANVTAILAGIASPARARSIVAVLARALSTPYGPSAVSQPAPSGWNYDISPYMGGFHVLADFAAGNDPAALSLIRQEWGFMLSHDPGGVDWEKIESTGIPGGGAIADSMAHAWSTGPTAALSQYVLGAAPTAPGFTQWSVAPQIGDLAWAQGVVPTPHGPLTVRWRRVNADRDSDTDAFVLSVAAPAGTRGTVTLPAPGARAALARDGRLLWNGRAPRGTIILRAVSGTHTYAWKCSAC